MNKQDWTYKKLGEVCKVLNGLWVGKKEPLVNIAVIRNTNFSKDCKLKLDDVAYIDVEERQFATRKLQVGDIIIEKSGGSDKQPVGRPVLFNIPDGEYSFSNFTSTLRLTDKSIFPPFLHYCLYGYYRNGETKKMQSKTTGLRNLDMKAYLRLAIPYFEIGEQERIVAELDLLSGIIEKKKEQLKAYDQLAQSIFYTMFGDPITNEKGWELKKLNDLSNVFAGGDVPKDSFSKTKSEKYSVPIYSNGIDNDGLYGYTAKARVCEPSITISGRGTIGFVALRNHPFYPIIRLIVITPIIPIDLVYLKFVCTAMNFKGVGVAIPQLTVPMIKFANIPVPSLSLQEEFAEKVEAIERQKVLVQQSIEETQTMFDCTMDKYFG